jgi:putative transposase
MPARRKEKCLVKFKSPGGVQKVLSLMGKTRNIFSVAVGRYTNSAEEQRTQFQMARKIWDDAAAELLCA